MGIKERKQQEKNEMKELIKKTALNLFLDEGYNHITMRHIAEKIQYSPATIYLYFKSKDEILYTLCREGFEKLYEKQKLSLEIKDPRLRLLKQGETYISFALENPEYYDLMFMMRGRVISMNEKEDIDIGLASYELLKSNIKDCMDAGFFPSTNIDVAAFSLWSCVHGIASLIIRGRGIMFPEKEINNLTKGAMDFMFESLIEKKRDLNNISMKLTQEMDV